MSTQKAKRRRTTFEFYGNGVNSVSISGDFNQWDENSHAMKLVGEGLWRKSLMLYPGTYEYKFKVDGQWINDPLNDKVCINCFGSRNNIIQVS